MTPSFLKPLFVLCLSLIGLPAFTQNSPPLTIVSEGIAPLVLTEPQPDPPALLGWLGDPRHRPQSELGSVLFHPAGRQLFAFELGQNDNHSLTLWHAQPGSAKLTLSGSYPLTKPWNLSGDGQLLGGVTVTGRGRTGAFGVWKFPSGEPLWQIGKDHPAVVSTAAFSQDGKMLGLLWKVGETQRLSIMEATTGRLIREIPISGSTFIRGELPSTLVFGTTTLLISPHVDTDGRLIEIPFADWTPRFHPTSGQDDFPPDWDSNTRLDLSRDGKWLAIWSNARCQVMEYRSGKWTTQLKSGDEWSFLGDDFLYHTIAITPDSKRVLVSGGGRHRLVDLSSGKVISHDPSGCRCGIYHPGGRIFVRTCYPFEANDAASLAPLPGGEVSGHTDAIESVDFTDGGKKMISTSPQFAHVWDLSGDTLPSAPITRLVLPARDTPWELGRLAWVPSLNEIQGADSFDFFRWKIPSNGQPWPTTITGELAYRGREGDRDMGLMMSVFPAPDGKSAVYHTNTGPFIMRTLSPNPAQVTSRTLAFKSVNDMTGEYRYHFMLDSQSFIYDSYGGIARYDLTTDQITQVKRGDSANLAGHSVSAGRIAGFSMGQLVLYDDKTLATLSKTRFSRLGSSLLHKRADFSNDGKWLACVVIDTSTGTEKIWLLDVTKQELSAVQPIQGRTSDLLRFTPDNQRLVIGYFGGAISVWDVAKLVATAPPSEADRTAAQAASAGAGTPPPAGSGPAKTMSSPTPPPAQNASQVFTEVPSKPLLPDKVTPWVWSPDCSASAAGDALQIGALKINGSPLKITSTKGHIRPGSGTLSARLEMEGALPEGQALLISRDVFCDVSASAYWADRLQNPTPSIQHVEVVFEFGFGRDLSELETGNRSPLILDGNIIRLPPGEEFIFSHVTKPDGTRHTSRVRVMIVGVEGLRKTQTEPFFIPPDPAVVPPASEPELRWDPARRIIQAVHKVTLSPYEHRLMLHTARSAPTPEGMTLNEWTASSTQGMTVSTYRWFYPEFASIALNYATPTSIWLAKQSGTFFRSPPEFKDQYGFTWTPALGGNAISNQLMLKHGFECYVDAWPLAGVREDREEGFRTPRASRQGDVSIAEKMNFTPSLGFRMESRVRYHGDAARNVEVTFVNLLRHPISQILDEKGASVPLDRTIPLSTLGSKFALVGKADDQPCALFSLGALSVKAAPELRFVDHQTLEIVYMIPMTPNEKLDLLHITAQQPLSAFPSAADMMAQWPPQ